MEVPVYCPDCDTTNKVDFDRSKDVLDRHNDQFHDGELVAGIRVSIGPDTEVLPHPQHVRDGVAELSPEIEDQIRAALS